MGRDHPFESRRESHDRCCNFQLVWNMGWSCLLLWVVGLVVGSWRGDLMGGIEKVVYSFLDWLLCQLWSDNSLGGKRFVFWLVLLPVMKCEYALREKGIGKVSFTFLDWCFYQLFEVLKVCQRVLKHIGSLFISRRHIEIMRCDISICIKID